MDLDSERKREIGERDRISYLSPLLEEKLEPAMVGVEGWWCFPSLAGSPRSVGGGEVATTLS